MASRFQIRQNALRQPKSRRQGGWVMLTLLLAMALLIIFAAAIIPSITFDFKRDREEEMIHRGVQYSRAIRAYYRKFGRYPTKIEDLENTNNLRFLRKRYKDPLNCKNSQCADFKLLHFGEVQLSLSGIAGGIPGANPIGANSGLNSSPGGFSQPSTFGSNSSFGSSSNSSFGQNQQSSGQPGQQREPDQTVPIPSENANDNPGNGTSSSAPLGSGQIIGGPIVGVASLCKDKTIREFNHKNKYKDWVFVYDPAQDQGHLITTPYQPQLQGFGQQQNINGQINPSGAGNPLGSSPSGLQNNPNIPMSGGFSTPNPPNNPPPPQ